MSDRTVPEIPGDPVSDEVASYLKTKVSQILHTRFNQFPGSQPVSFTREHLQTLAAKDYLVCEKSDGLRLLMFVLINQDTGEEGTFLINRENEYYMVPGFHFPRSSKNFDTSHHGTILDGELVFSTNPTNGVREVRYLIFDCLAMDMVSVMHKNLWKRLYHAQQEFHKPYIDLRRTYPDACAHFPFKLDFKNMTQAFKMDRVFKEMKNLTHVSDGLVLTCCDAPYTPGTDQSLLKWKPAEENTIDFKIRLRFPRYVDEELPKHDPNREYPDYDAKPEFRLCVFKGGRDPYADEDPETNTRRNGGVYVNSFALYDDWRVPLQVSDQAWQQMKESGESFNGRIAECRRVKDGKWQMLRWRDDKLNGNHISVVLRILQSIEDSVTKQELVGAEAEIKQGWDDRIAQKRQQGPHIGAPAGTNGTHAPQHAPQIHAAPQPQIHAPQPPPPSDDLPHYSETKSDEDSDEYYESDGFEEAPKFTSTEPDPKRQKI